MDAARETDVSGSVVDTGLETMDRVEGLKEVIDTFRMS